MARFSSDEVEKAKQVLRGAYYQGVSSEAADLVRRVLDGEIADHDSLTEAVDEVCDSAMTYTADQYLTVFISQASENGLEETADMGVDDVQQVLAPWGSNTYRIDVHESFEHFDLNLDELLEMEPGERLVWLANERGMRLYTDAEGDSVFFVGTLNEGQRGEIDLGVVSLGPDESTTRESTRSFFKRVAPQLMSIAEAAEHRDDKDAFAVLRDAVLELGLDQGEPEEES